MKRRGMSDENHKSASAPGDENRINTKAAKKTKKITKLLPKSFRMRPTRRALCRNSHSRLTASLAQSSKSHERAELTGLVKGFICEICMDLIVSSVTTKCGHSFCEICLFDYLTLFAKCPLCARRLRHSNSFGACKEMDNMIDKMLKESGDEELLTEYRERVQRNKSWNRQRMISEFRVGMSLDVQNKEYIWLVGVVKKMVIRAKNFKFLIIGYRVGVHANQKGLSSVYDEEIICTSNRLAPRGFFTDRPGFPKVVTDALGAHRIKIGEHFVGYNFFKSAKSCNDYKQFTNSDSSYCSESGDDSHQQ